MFLKGVKMLWNLKVDPNTLWSKANNLILKTRTAFDTVESIATEDVTFENFLKVLSDIDRDFYTEKYYFDFFSFTSPDKSLRNASSEIEKKLREFILETNMRKGLYEKLLAFEAKQMKLPHEATRYLKRLIETRKRIGLHLSDDVQNGIKILQTRANDLALKFYRNISEDQTFVELTDEELVGLSDDFINGLTKDPDTHKRKVTMKYPDYLPIMKKAKNPEIRKKLNFAYGSRCVKENIPLIEEIGTLRHKFARLLAFNTFSDYRADVLMIKSANNIDKFLMDLAKKVSPLWEEEKKYMLKLKEMECDAENIPFDGKLNSWDLSYYMDKVYETKYALDTEKVKEYFPMAHVIKTVFEIYQKLFDLTFQKLENIEAWHPDVEAYSVTDNESQELLGYFFLDLFPRDGKYSHFCAREMQPGCLDADGTRQLGVVGILGNFSKPVSDEKPSLLLYSEVRTFFHEFGHVIHYLSNQAEYCEFSCIQVERDFIETPSQMLENWCLVPEILKKVSSHYIDGSPLPDDIIAAIKNSTLANIGHFYLKQICYSIIDQQLHTHEKIDTANTERETSKNLLGLEIMEGTNFCATFFHVVSRYAATYFCYLWCEVCSIDIFESHFGDKGVLDSDLGKVYRERILKPGATKDTIDLLKDFLGREPNQEAFLRKKGLPV